LRFDEVRSSGEQHDVVVVFVPPACVAVVGVVVDCVRRRTSQLKIICYHCLF
jgi:hypothetical protein